MKNVVKKIIIVGGLSLTLFSNVIAETKLNYPELEVTPRASERLKMLAEKEHSNSFFSPAAMQISALSTLTTGLLQFGSVDESEDPDKKSPLVGVVVGGVWLGVNFYLSQGYKIYNETLADVNKISGNGLREQLTRERIAEEGINKAARIASRLKWMSALTNGGASIYMLQNVEKDSAAQIMGFVSVAASLAPILFESDWEVVARNQRSYKKKVYGPIFTSSVFNVGEGKWAPGVLFASSF